MALRGAGDPWAGLLRGGGAGALPFEGSGLVVGPVGPLRRRRWRLGAPAWCLRVPGPGGGFPPSMDLPRRAAVPGSVDAAAVVAGGTGPVFVGVVVPAGAGLGGPLWCGRGGRANTVLGRGGGSLVVGGVVGLSAWWVVLPSLALVLLVHGGWSPGGVGWWAVVVVVVGLVLGVVVVVVLVVVAAGALLAVVVVVGIVVMMVLWVCP